MSQLNTQQMGRLIAAGSKDKLSEAISALSQLKALHILDYDGTEEGFSLGSPDSESENVGKLLVKARSAASVVEIEGPESAIHPSKIRKLLSEDFPSKIDDLLDMQSRVDDLDSEISSLEEEESSLELLASLDIDLELLTGYDSIESFVGIVTEPLQVEANGNTSMIFQSKSGKVNVVAVFTKTENARQVNEKLEKTGFQPINLPQKEGAPSARLEEIRAARKALQNEKSTLGKSIERWVDSNGKNLACGLEILERDHDVHTAPTRVAVSEHAFIIDGWIEMKRSHEVLKALSKSCLHSEVKQFEMIPGGGGHGHHGDHNQEMPPISYQERSTSKPMELLTDAVGRPAYGRVDPTIFMLVTYPLFFGMMLGDMAYGLVTMGLGWTIIRKSGTNELMNLGGRFLTYIGLGTLIFGYIYAEFAGWEIFLYEKSKVDGIYIYGDNTSPVAFLANLYPFNLDHGYGPVADLGYGITLSFPFHRVGTHLEDLIVLTIYVGFFHVLAGLAIGFRDILIYGNGHGGVGFVCAFFEKGTWMALLIGGWMLAYGFLGSPDQMGYLSESSASSMVVPGASIVLVSVVLLMWTLYKYHGVPFPINIGLAPIEAVGMMPTVISYVRLFAVGVVGVKIAETGNHMLFEPMAKIIGTLSEASTADYISIPLLFVGWISVQSFAIILGLFSPNIHAARLHFVEWMRQYYDSSGEEFRPFGPKPKYVEAD